MNEKEQDCGCDVHECCSQHTNTPPEQENNEGINIVVCPIHGNKKYNIKPPHFCDHKIPGYANSHCACICTCLGTHKIEDWRKAFWKQFTQDGEILADEYATQTPKEIEEFIENEKKESYAQGWNEGQQALRVTPAQEWREAEIAYDEHIDGHHVQLRKDGLFIVDGKESGKWEDDRTKKPWIPVKRKNFMSIAKQYLRD